MQTKQIGLGTVKSYAQKRIGPFDRLLDWAENGLWAVDRKVFDCGIQTRRSLRAYATGTPPQRSGLVVPEGKGNGALMRVLPLALFLRSDNETLVQIAHEQALVTHGHICNQMCCALYSLWARHLLFGRNPLEGYTLAVKYLSEYYRHMPDYLYELECCTSQGVPTGSGYVVDSIRSAKYLLEQHSDYEGVVKGAVRLGKDTDTTAAIAGGLAGIAYGGIPKHWLDGLRGKDLVEPLLKALFVKCD